MSIRRDELLRRHGTRFALYPQSPVLESVARPEIVWVSPRPGSLGPGPSDARMYVVDPAVTKEPYENPVLPPYRGPAHPPAAPSPDGHFDHLPVGSREFRAAHMYGVLRRVLDIWEDYFARPIRWHFESTFERLEIVPSLEWDNAHSGYGFIEAGFETSDSGVSHHYALNFDVLAHELGHSILYSQLGVPPPGELTAEYLALHESCADVIALVSGLHFDSVVDRLLEQTAGNLYTLNELNRIAETSDSEQIRIASNGLRMSDVAHAFDAMPTSCDEHALGQPVTGALFDVLVDVFLGGLQSRGAIPDWLVEASRAAPDERADIDGVQAGFDAAYAGNAGVFKASLLEARDYLGETLASALLRLGPVVVTFSQLHRVLREADLETSGGSHGATIGECFDWREIGLASSAVSTRRHRAAIGRGDVKGLARDRRAPYLARARERLGAGAAAVDRPRADDPES